MRAFPTYFALMALAISVALGAKEPGFRQAGYACTVIDWEGECLMFGYAEPNGCTVLKAPFVRNLSSVNVRPRTKCIFFQYSSCTDRPAFAIRNIDNKSSVSYQEIDFKKGFGQKVQAYNCIDMDEHPDSGHAVRPDNQSLSSTMVSAKPTTQLWPVDATTNRIASSVHTHLGTGSSSSDSTGALDSSRPMSAKRDTSIELYAGMYCSELNFRDCHDLYVEDACFNMGKFANTFSSFWLYAGVTCKFYQNDWCITNNFRDYAVFTGGPTGRYLAAVAPTINDNIRSYSCCC